MALDDDQLHDLIHACYDAALDPGRWPGLLARLRDTIGAADDGREVGDASDAEPGQSDPDRVALALLRVAATVGPGDGPLGRLLPHLDRCAQIRVRLATTAGLAAALDRLPLAVLMLDADGRLVHANRLAAGMLHAGEPLAMRDGRIATSGRPETGRLRALIAAAGTGCGAGVVTTMLLRASPPAPPRALTIAALPAGGGIGRGNAAVLLLVRDPARAKPVAGACLVELFGLTGPEARVATALLGADSPREVAAQLGIGLATVRSHLHALYAKTGTSRQAELVWLLATLALL